MQRVSRRNRARASQNPRSREASRVSLEARARVLALLLFLGSLPGCSDTPASRSAQIQAWGRRGETRNAERIARSVSDPDRDVRIAALQALASIRAAEAEASALTALADKDPQVRAAAVGCLAQLGAWARLPEISELFASDPAAGVRGQCVVFVQKSGADAADELLATAVRDPDRAVRILAVRGLEGVDPLFAIDPLAGAVLQDSDWEVRAEAARVLGAARRRDAAPALEAALSDPNEFVRAAASAALKQLNRE